MTTSVLGLGPHLEHPAAWPEGLSPDVLSALDLPTPFLAGDLRHARRPLPAVRPRPAQRARALRGQVQLRPGGAAHRGRPRAPGSRWRRSGSCGCCSRSASTPPTSCTATPSSRPRTSSRPPGRVCGASPPTPRASCTRSPASPPGSAVYIRVRVDDSGSIFPLSRKFGAEAHHARALLQEAAAARPAAVRADVPRRLAVRRHLGLAAGDRLGRAHHAQPAARTASGWRCSTSAGASRRATATRSRPSSRSATSSSGRWTSCSPTSRR